MSHFHWHGGACVTELAKGVEVIRGLCHGNDEGHVVRAKTGQVLFGCDSGFPLRRSIRSEPSQCRSGDEVALKIEGIVDGGMHAQEALGGSS
jgi:hypothetical protein